MWEDNGHQRVMLAADLFFWDVWFSRRKMVQMQALLFGWHALFVGVFACKIQQHGRYTETNEPYLGILHVI